MQVVVLIFKTIGGLLAGRRSLIAVDFGSTAIKFANVEYREGRASIKQLHSFSLPSRSFDDWLEGEGNDLNDILQSAVKDLGLQGQDVVTAMPGSGVITRHIQMPEMSKKEMRGALKWEAQKFIPVPLNDMELRHVELEKITVDGIPKVNLLLIACPRELIYKYYQTFKDAELNIVALDLQYFALWRLFTYKEWGLPTGSALALANVGASYCQVLVLRKGKIAYTRNFPVGIGKEINEQTLGVLATGLKGSLEFYRKHNQESTLTRLVLCGGGSRIVEVKGFINQNIDLKSEVFDLFEPSYVVAVGLALREVTV